MTFSQAAAAGSFTIGYSFTPQWGMGRQQNINAGMFEGPSSYDNHIIAKQNYYAGQIYAQDKPKNNGLSDAQSSGGGTSGVNMSGKNSWNSPSDPYQNSGIDDPVSLSTFVNIYKNTSFTKLITEAGWRDGLPAGPKMRYVINPNDNRVMDMRHVLVVGFMGGNLIGFGVEVAQWYGGYIDPRIRGSAFNLQDFYSNNIGAGFSWHYYLNGGGNVGTSFGNYLNQK